MKSATFLLVACLCALAAPAFDRSTGTSQAREVPRWPSHFQGRPLREIPMPARDRELLSGFPGAVALFTDGEHDIVLRWVTQATRRLHPATDCYQAMGHDVSATRIITDGERTQWRCFDALRDGVTRRVCEQLQDREGRRWTDVSAWYWAAAFHRSEGPWLVTTVATRGD